MLIRRAVNTLGMRMSEARLHDAGTINSPSLQTRTCTIVIHISDDQLIPHSEADHILWFPPNYVLIKIYFSSLFSFLTTQERLDKIRTCSKLIYQVFWGCFHPSKSILGPLYLCCGFIISLVTHSSTLAKMGCMPRNCGYNQIYQN